MNDCGDPNLTVARINDHLMELMFYDTSIHSWKARCCFCCETELMKGSYSRMKLDRIKGLKELFCRKVELHPQLVEDYRFKGHGRKGWMQDMMISKFACYEEESDAFITCNKCYDSLRHGSYPVHGICNGFYTGYAPSIIEELTDIELAFISPVRMHGHIFTYFGGAKGIKGWHSLLKCDLQSAARSLHGMDRLNMPNRIAIVLSGPMTEKQRNYIKTKLVIRRDLCLKAIQNQMNINSYTAKDFNGFDFNSLPTPIIIDKAQATGEGVTIDSNVELREEFTVVFPDATLNDTYGGFSTVKDFKTVLEEVKKVSGIDMVLQSRGSNYTTDYTDDNLVKAFPKQFPYGRGGPKETRYDKSGNAWKIDISDYIRHMNALVNPNFHTQLFTLVSYNILQRQKMLQQACWKLKETDSITSKIAGITDEEIRARVTNKQHGLSHGTLGAIKFIDLVDAITGCLPHSNKAAKRARGQAFAMQVEFGFPAVFFTVTPDDSNSIMIMIYSGFNSNCFVDTVDWNDIDLDTIKDHATTKESIRIKYSGICAVWFEAVLDIIMKDIVGWNFEKNGPTDEPGYLPTPEAVFAAIEEQTRKRLHAHILIFLKGYNKILNDMQHRCERKQATAKRQMIKLHEQIVSTSLIEHPKNCMFSHATNCNMDCPQKLPTPKVMSKQHLRYLRHKEGCKAYGGTIAYCESCGKKWSSEELVLSYLKYMAVDNGKLDKLLTVMEDEGEKDISMLKDLLYHGTHDLEPFEFDLVVNCIHNLHSSSHVKQCFKYDEECRYNYPTCACKATELISVDKCDKWYSWNGLKLTYIQYEIERKRNDYDLFINSYFPVVSKSNIATNSNARLISDARASFYTTNYETKLPQDEDESEYERVLNFTQKRMYECRHETDFSESLSRLLGASFTHSSKNVISPWLAKYLIRNGSRFLLSHIPMWIPVYDIEDALFDQPSKHAYVKHHYNEQFLDNTADHYRYRPKELEDVTCEDFFVNFNVIHRSRSNEDGLFIYDDELYPGTGYMGAIESKAKNRIANFPTKFFTDSSQFNCDILTCDKEQINDIMESYARRVLIVYASYRCLADLQKDGSYVKRFQEWYATSTECTDHVKQSLTNIQNLKNTNKLVRVPDSLKKDTEPFKSAQGKANTKDNTEESDTIPDEFIQSLISENLDGLEPQFQQVQQQNIFDMDNIISEGRHLCGKKHISNVIPNQNDTHFIEIENILEQQEDETTLQSTEKATSVTSDSYTVLLAERVERVTNKDGPEEDQKIDITANGSVESIVKWGKYMGRFDSDQQRAFEILAGKFVLTYFPDMQETEYDPNIPGTVRGRTRNNRARKERRRLEAMAGKRVNEQILMFLTGAGGSGKSEVVKQLLQYAKEFCSNLGVPFTDRTILVTAMSGVAATLIHGETLHSGVHLNVSLDHVSTTMIEEFEGVRMLVIDEISMASVQDIRKLDEILRKLKQVQNAQYGNLDIAFMGDFSQLPTINGTKLYEDWTCTQWHEWINCFIELKGMWRFKDDLEYGYCCLRFREGKPKPDDFDLINSRHIDDVEDLPDGITYGVPENKDRDAINTASFLKYLDTHGSDKALLILGSDVKIVSKKHGEQTLKNLNIFWTQCGENDTAAGKDKRIRFDPMLKLYPGCPVMLLANTDVRGGVANGSQATVVGVQLKHGTETFQVQLHGHNVRAVLACDVVKVKIKLTAFESLNEKEIESNNYTVQCRYPLPPCFATGKKKKEVIKIKAKQFPIVSNTATTGHKLQGSTKKNLYIPYWNYHTQNWPYVMLSRVTTRYGLFLGEKLDPNRDYSLDSRIIRMYKNFERHVPEPFEHDFF